MSSQDLVKFLTQEFVKYVETPKSERHKEKTDETWGSRWFGMIPMSIKMIFRR